MNKRERDIILGRRTRFIRVTLAGIGLTASLESCTPEPCLSIAVPDATADAGADAQSDAGPQPGPSASAPEEPKK